MKITSHIAIAAVLAGLAACSSNTTANNEMNATTDMNAGMTDLNATDMNAGMDMNATGNMDMNATGTNETANTTGNTTTNGY